MITDTSATKPEDWLENEPETIPDPEAEKPEEWDVSCQSPCPELKLMNRTRRMETGFLLWFPTLNVRMSDVAPGPLLPSETPTTRVNGPCPRSPTLSTRVNGLLDRSLTPPSSRTARLPTSPRLPVLELSYGP
jgi:hypothetical protein